MGTPNHSSDKAKRAAALLREIETITEYTPEQLLGMERTQRRQLDADVGALFLPAIEMCERERLITKRQLQLVMERSVPGLTKAANELGLEGGEAIEAIFEDGLRGDNGPTPDPKISALSLYWTHLQSRLIRETLEAIDIEKN